MKVALRLLVVALRVHARSSPGRSRHPLASRSALDRVLGQTPVDEESVPVIKAALRDLVHVQDDAARGVLAVHVADLLVAVVARLLSPETRVQVALLGRPAGFTDSDAFALLGTQDGWLTAGEAALAVHRLSGTIVGGCRLSVDVALPPRCRLPAVPRELRGDRGRWGRALAWLPHLDGLGRRSLTPRGLAQRMAARVPSTSSRVVDACSGCGGNAVAFAEVSCRVLAVELDADRARMCRDNASARGILALLEVRCGSIECMLPGVLQPGDVLFVDPPWEPFDGSRAVRAETFAHLFAPLPKLADAVSSWPRVLLKLPRVFDVDSLPGGAHRWAICYERGSSETGDHRVVRMITASRGLTPPA